MLIGLGNKKPVTAPPAESADVFSVSTQEFETKIMAEAQKRPVLIDFWAPWCAPCKQLMPLLEEIVAAQKGKIALAKVNIDDNPELAQAFRVQSVPTVVAFFMGQPVAGFQGVRPKSEIDTLINQLIQMQKAQMPDALDIPALLIEASEAMKENNYLLAQNLYAEILREDPQNPQAWADNVRIMIAMGHIDQAQLLNQNIPETLSKNPLIVSVRTALDLALNAPKEPWQELEAKISDDPETSFQFAEACFAAGQKEKAVEALIGIMRKNKAWEDDKARKQLIKYFEAWGAMDPVSLQGRRKLSSLLFS